MAEIIFTLARRDSAGAQCKKRKRCQPIAGVVFSRYSGLNETTFADWLIHWCSRALALFEVAYAFSGSWSSVSSRRKTLRRSHPGRWPAVPGPKPGSPKRRDTSSRTGWPSTLGGAALRINEIVNGERAITADTALRLGRYFKRSTQFWLNLQSHHDLEVVGDRLGRRLEREVKELVMASGKFTLRSSFPFTEHRRRGILGDCRPQI
jgi:plasmid maintenance system antidote protein VapI